MWNKISSSKIFYMILAIVCAIGCWLYVDVVQAPDVPKTIYNIPVTFIGEDALADQGLMIISGKDTTVTLNITASRSIVSQIDRSNVTVSVQASTQITSEGEYSLNYDIRWPNTVSNADITIKSRSVSNINVSVVQMTSKDVEIRGRFTGSVVEGAVFDENEFQFELPTVTVSGERSLVDQVDYAEVTLDAQDLSATWSGELDIVLMDADGNPVDTTNLSWNLEKVYTVFPIQVMKEIPLTVDFTSGGGATEDDISYSIDPGTVTITGTPEQLDQIESISLGTIDLSTVITSDVVTFDIPVPDGVTIISGASMATVTVSVSGLTPRVVETSNIEFINQPEGIDVELVTQSLTVRIRGPEEVMSSVLDSDVYVIVDLANIDTSATGSRTLSAKVGVRGFADVGAIGEYQVIANITKS